MQGTEARILNNALQHFCSFGYNGTSVREITSASHVTKPTLYYYFKNKEELFIKLANYCFSLVLNEIEKCLGGEKDFKSSLSALFQCMNGVSMQDPAALKFIYSVIVAPQRGTPEVGAKEFMVKLNQLVQGIVERAIQQGECDPLKKEGILVMVSALLGLYSKCVITSGIVETSTMDMDRVIETLAHCAAKHH
nr:Bacterial regulatory proteins, tetR family [uncultured bacterium]